MTKSDNNMPAERKRDDLGRKKSDGAGRRNIVRLHRITANALRPAGILVLLGLLVSCSAGNNTVSVEGRVFSAEIARTDREKADGLMFRKELAGNACMVFLYDGDDYRTTWMKNCFISLDILWVDEKGKVVEIEENVPPCPADVADCPFYGGRVLSRHFVEFAAGTVSKLRIRTGDRIGWTLSVSQEGKWINTPGDG